MGMRQIRLISERMHRELVVVVTRTAMYVLTIIVQESIMFGKIGLC